MCHATVLNNQSWQILDINSAFIQNQELKKIRFKFQDFSIFCMQYLGRLILATIEQYRISFNRNTIVVNDHFIREGHLW